MMKKKFPVICLLATIIIIMEPIDAENKNNSTSIQLATLTTNSFDEDVRKAPHFVMFHHPRYSFIMNFYFLYHDLKYLIYIPIEKSQYLI